MTNQHLTRLELLKAAQERSGSYQAHLDSCAECRNELKLLARYVVAGKVALPEPPEVWVTKAIALAVPKPSLAKRLGAIIAELTFDSWSLPAPAGVRGMAPLTQRRLRFTAEPVTLEIRAEKKTQQWSFVAQTGGVSPEKCVLEVAGAKLRADAEGFIQWTSKTPPRSLILTAGDLVIEAPELSWKKPKP